MLFEAVGDDGAKVAIGHCQAVAGIMEFRRAPAHCVSVSAISMQRLGRRPVALR